MPNIDLNQKTTYTGGGVSVEVTEETYQVCKIFHKYTHKPKGDDWRIGRRITLLKSSHVSKTPYYVNFVTYYRYQFNSLESAIVYFNRYDANNANPLVLVLLFKGSSVPQRKYLELSNLDRKSSFEINSLENYEDEAQLLSLIFKENTKLNKQITFKVDQSSGQSTVKTQTEEIDTIFKRITFMADTSAQKHIRLNETYELCPSKLLENGKNSIDETFNEFKDKKFNAVCVYYYKTENIALLIELVEDYVLRHIRRKQSNGNSKWVTEDLKIQYLCNMDLTNYLKTILLCLKNKIVVKLDQQREYAGNKVIDSVSGASQSTVEGKKITPTKNCTTPKKYDGYVCYNHSLKEYFDTNLGNLVGKIDSSSTFNFTIYLEICFSIFNKEISICSSEPSKKEHLFYKPGPGPPGDNVYVYFYETGEKQNQPDTVPLMMEFDKNFYGPNKTDDYFKEWSKINGSQQRLDISSSNGHIKSKLDDYNKSLNQICLIKTSNYGLTELTSFTKADGFNFRTDRVSVKKFDVPPFREFDTINSDNVYCQYGVYSKYVHSTLNTFRLGPIKFQNNTITEGNGTSQTNGKVIEAKGGQNQLSVCYLTTDKKSEYPLLIGIGKQNNGIDDFYQLESKSPGYKWKKLDESDKLSLKSGSDIITLVKLLDKINYPLKKSAKIEINQRRSYVLKVSPITSGAERFETISGQKVLIGQNHICENLWDYGYRRLFHNISDIRNFDYGLIGSLKFYIPGSLSKEDGSVQDSNKEISLHKIVNHNDEIRKKVIDATSYSEISSYLKEFKPIYYSSCKPEVFVYFYRDDPRPGLLCFGETTYKPIKIPEWENGKYNYTDDNLTKWVEIRRTKKCVCENPAEFNFLTEVLDGLYFSSAFDKFISEYWVTLSVGAGGGVVGVGSLAGGGYVLFSYISGLQLLL